MELFIDPAQRRGVASELFDQLREAIVNGRLRHGDRVPPSRDLARELGISRHTVTTVYGRLVAEGFLEGRAGGGTHVSYAAGSPQHRVRSTDLRPRQVPNVDYVTEPPPEGGVDLRIGLPDRGLFPLTPWRRCVVSALQVAPAAGGEPAGHADLRRTLAHWIGRSRGVDVDAANVVVTTGAQGAVDLVARVFLRPGDRVAFEEPGYTPVRHLLETSGLDVVPVPVDDQGIIVEAIPVDVRLVYVTPSHQSPTGATMSLPRRRALLELADRHEMAIIEDDYDSEYRHADRPLEPLFRLDRAGRVLYVGTFSKTLSPTLRLGFVVLPDSLTPSAVKVAELVGSYPPAVVQAAMYHFIGEGHLDRHLRKARRVYGERHTFVAAFIREMVATGLLRPGPTGHAGLHLAARLPAGVSEHALIERVRRDDVALTSLANSWMGQPRWQALLIGFGRADPPHLARGLAVLRDALQH
jgi:GntR family transcriptional regulator / MocR family aminotransferase